MNIDDFKIEDRIMVRDASRTIIGWAAEGRDGYYAFDIKGRQIGHGTHPSIEHVRRALLRNS